jgi:hypothetical protein
MASLARSCWISADQPMSQVGRFNLSGIYMLIAGASSGESVFS